MTYGLLGSIFRDEATKQQHGGVNNLRPGNAGTTYTMFDNIFSTSDVSSVWSDRTRVANYLCFEGCLARVQGDLDIIPRDAAVEIDAFCSDVNNVNFEQLTRDTEKIGYPVLGLVQQIVRQVNTKHPGLGEWAHYGATTQVILPSVKRQNMGGIDCGFVTGRD